VAWNGGNRRFTTTYLVSTKQPNELGMYDMSGNACEWFSNLYDKGHYNNSPHNNPQGSESEK